MPGFYRKIPNGTFWTTYKPFLGRSFEMSFAETDILFNETIPNLKEQLFSEGVKDIEISLSTCHPPNGECYGQVSAQGIAPF